MALTSGHPQHIARVVPIHTPRGETWHGDLLRFLVGNPRHLTWLTERPVIRHFVDEVLLAHMVHDRAERVVVYHSSWRFEVDFWLEGRRHRVEVPNHRWALAVVLRLKRLAGMDVTNPVAWQVGEITRADGLLVDAWLYPTVRSERLILRPRREARLVAAA